MTEPAQSQHPEEVNDCGLCSSWRRVMEGLLRALGFENKPDYTEKIPETLTENDLDIHETFHHGFPHQPTCLAYDAVQQLLAIGTETGAVLLLGKPGLERHITHPSNVAVTHMRFICNKGLLITCCSNNTLYLWSLYQKEPSIKHSLELNRESPTCISYCTGSEWACVGTDGGNVHVIHIKTFKLSGYTVYWNHACEISSSRRTKPGNVIFVSEHPMDQGKILIAYSNGLCVLYDLFHNEVRTTTQQKEDYHKRYSYDPGEHHILTSVCWQGNGRYFACSYSNGCVVVWNVKTEHKPEKIMYIHESPDKTSFKPIHKVQIVHTDGDPWFFCSGGYPENSDVAPRTLTVMHGKSTTLLSSDSTILDFLCLPTSPYTCDQQKPFALVILSKDEVILHDLHTPGLPRYPNVSLPYALDIHLPPVTSIQYLANCSEEFIASLHSVKSKLMNTTAKPWPLNGGKWGSEVPHASTDLILTGHVDGSVRLWYCSSVIFQPFFTLTTSRYFKMCYQAASIKLTPPPTRQPPARPPPPRKQQSQPSSQLTMVVRGLHTSKGLSVSQPEINKIGVKHYDNHDEVLSRKKITTSPATGQISSEEHDVSHDSPDGQQTASDALGISCTSEGSSTPGSERKVVYSREKKSIFKKRKRRESAAPALPHLPPSPTPTEPHLGDHHVKEDKKSPKVTRTSKSFRRVAKIVKLSRSVSSASDKGKRSSESIEEVDAGEKDSDKDSPLESQSVPEHGNGATQQEMESTTSPKRPSDITIRESSKLTGPVTGPGIILTPSDVSLDTGSTSEKHPGATAADNHPIRSKSPTKMSPHSPQQKRVSETNEHAACSPLSFATRVPQLLEDEDEFFGINEVHMCLCGLWLCVANRGGCVMAFDFSLSSKTREAKFLEINFDNDSIMRQYATRPASPPKPSSPPPTQSQPRPTPGEWYFDDKVQDSKPGFQLTQLCMCYYTSVKSPNGSGSNKTEKKDSQRMPIAVSTMQYSVDKGLLVVGTNRGFAIVDVFSNSCLYTFCSVTSILYMANPNKFSRQIRQESQLGLNAVKKATISRHATSLALSVKAKNNHSTTSTPVKRAASAKPLTMKKEKSRSHIPEQDCTDEVDSHMTVSELESCVSALELVQLQLDKQSPPTLTLWVGLASGYVAAYGFKVIQRPGQTRKQRRVEHIPTRFISESSGKYPIVDMFFLNEWGDRQVVPYKPRRTLSVGSEEQLQHVLQQERTRAQQKAQTPSNAPQHYAIFVDENQIRSFSFPGFVKITVCHPPIAKGSVILRNEYFMCNDLPCLLSITSCKHILVHSLPGLKPLMTHHFCPLGDPRVMCTFRVSGNGHAMYMSSASEIQRMSIIKRDMLNLPECLPDVYVPMEDPPLGVSKGFLGGLFGTTPTTVDRERMFGEASRRPMGNMYRHDGKMGTAYSGTERRRSLPRNEPLSPQKQAGGAKGLGGQMNRNVDALKERKDKLSAIERRTQEVSQNADEFASLASQLARKHERR